MTRLAAHGPSAPSTLRRPVIDAQTLKLAPAQLETARLRLERPRLAHAPQVMDSVNASLRNLRFIHWGQQAFDEARARRFCANNADLVERGECLIYFVFEIATGAIVGNLDLHSFAFDVPRCEIGYVGDARTAGRGLMFEAASAVMHLGFGLGLQRIAAYVDVRNERSLRFAQQLGMRREGVLRSYARDPQGECNDEVVYARLWNDPAPVWAPPPAR